MDFWVEAGRDGEFWTSEETEKGQYEHCVKSTGCIDGVVASAESGDAFGEDV